MTDIIPASLIPGEDYLIAVDLTSYTTAKGSPSTAAGQTVTVVLAGDATTSTPLVAGLAPTVTESPSGTYTCALAGADTAAGLSGRRKQSVYLNLFIGAKLIKSVAILVAPAT